MSKYLYFIRHGQALHNELFPKLGDFSLEAIKSTMSNTMKSAVLIESNKPLIVTDLDLPKKLEFGQVLVLLD